MVTRTSAVIEIVITTTKTGLLVTPTDMAITQTAIVIRLTRATACGRLCLIGSFRTCYYKAREKDAEHRKFTNNLPDSHIEHNLPPGLLLFRDHEGFIQE